MPQLYTDTGQRVGVLTGRRKLHVKHALEYDEKTLHFEYPVAGPYAAHLVNEAYPQESLKDVDSRHSLFTSCC